MQTETHLAILAQHTETRRDYGYIVLEQRLHTDGGDLPNMGAETPNPGPLLEQQVLWTAGHLSDLYYNTLHCVEEM